MVPEAMHQKMTIDPYEFQQAPNMSMTEYESRFRELSRYAPKRAKLEAKFSERFFKGQLPRYVEIMASHKLWTIR